MRCAFIAVLLASAAMAQTDTGSSGVRVRDLRTMGNVKFFVDGTNGSDASSNTCQSSGAGACKSMQAVSDRTRALRVGHNIEVSVATGNYGCSTWGPDGDEGSADAGIAGYLWVHGTPIPATASGLMSGAVQAATEFVANQSGSDSTLPTVNVSDAGWTAHALKGDFFYIATGPGQGEKLTIADNTDHVLTLAGGYSNATTFMTPPSVYAGNAIANPFGDYTIPTSSSTYAILTPGTHLTQDCYIPAGPAPTDGGFLGTYPNQANDTAAVIVTGMRGGIYAGRFDESNSVFDFVGPQTGVTFSDFDINDVNAGAGFYVSNTDFFQARWTTNTSAFWFGFMFNNVNSISLMSNYTTSGNLFYSFDSIQSRRLVEAGNVSAGYVTYDAFRPALSPSIWWSMLNSYAPGAGRVGISVNGSQYFHCFGDFIVGTDSQSAITFGDGAPTGAARIQYCKLQSNGYGVLVDSPITITSAWNTGSSSTAGYLLSAMGASLSESNDHLTGTTSDMCLGGACTSNDGVVTYTQLATSDYMYPGGGRAHAISAGNVQTTLIAGPRAYNIKASPLQANGVQVFGTFSGSTTTSATSVPSSVGCTDTPQTITGATVDKACAVSPHSAPTSAGGWSAGCYASTSGTIQLHLCCISATCTANSVTWTIQQ